ncbi:MAG: TRAP transporter small permease [Spirochaetales bacterium]|uniref:TRAP transporter small permease n=1 Tax=Candidatus Thalassospirochaeta sargassi TaxID=3119039 RepID=A0AAJ1IFU8_9SPIO|nr:TRAP transporter small permease [Spirochaetales bacterium]
MENNNQAAVFKIENGLNKLLNSLITVIFFVIVVLTILLVVLRYVFNTGITGGNELMEYLFVYTTAIGAAIAIGKNEHIRIGFFVEHRGRIVQMITDLLSIVCIALINIVFMYLSYTWISKVGHSESPVLRIPMRLVQISVPIGCILSVVYCGFNIYKIFTKKTGENW